MGSGRSPLLNGNQNARNTKAAVHATVGRVSAIEELTEFKKPIRAVKVDVGEAEPRDIVCGATNFAVGDLVVVALPGTVLPGDFTVDNGLLTPSLKVRRAQAQERFAKEIDALYTRTLR